MFLEITGIWISSAGRIYSSHTVKDRHVYVHYRFATVGDNALWLFVMNNVMHLEG